MLFVVDAAITQVSLEFRFIMEVIFSHVIRILVMLNLRYTFPASARLTDLVNLIIPFCNAILGWF